MVEPIVAAVILDSKFNQKKINFISKEVFVKFCAQMVICYLEDLEERYIYILMTGV